MSWRRRQEMDGWKNLFIHNRLLDDYTNGSRLNFAL